MKIVTILFPNAARDEATVIAEVQAAAQRLSTATSTWSTTEPRRAAIDEAMVTCHGLQRVLAELHERTVPAEVHGRASRGHV